MTNEVNCCFQTCALFRGEQFYTCVFAGEHIGNDAVYNFEKGHLFGKSNNNVTGVYFTDCEIMRIPQGFTKFFPNLVALCVHGSNLKVISSQDLKEYSKLKILSIMASEIEYLPSDLLTYSISLEVISFNRNKLQIIEPNVFDHLKSLRYLNLCDNSCINKYYDVKRKEECSSLSDIRRDIKRNFSFWVQQKFEKEKFLLQEINDLRLQLTEVEKKNVNVKRDYDNLKNQQQIAKARESSVFCDLKRALQCDDTKDLTISVEGSDIKAHKLVFAARSTFFAELLKKNITGKYLLLEKISIGIFLMIYNYIYFDEFPSVSDDKLVELFEAVAKYEILVLKDYVGKILINKINTNNALEVLILSNKYKCENLQKKSLDYVKQLFPNRNLTIELINNPEKLTQALEIKKKAEFQLNAIFMSKPEEKVEFDDKGRVKTERPVARVMPRRIQPYFRLVKKDSSINHGASTSGYNRQNTV